MNKNIRVTAFTMYALSACAIAQQPDVTFSDIKDDISEITSLEASFQVDSLVLLMDQYPLFTHDIMRYLLDETDIERTTIDEVANEKSIIISKLQYWQNVSDVVITPLFHSASVSVKNDSEVSGYFVQYKQLNSQTWSSTIQLVLDPISNMFTSSLLNLQENTQYEVNISSDEDFKLSSTNSFKTKGTPIFSIENTYLLSDIYQGGVLDIVGLGLNGTEDNWIKIIGDDDTVISVDDSEASAINIGSNSYIYFENITVNGGGKHAVSANEAHHLWFNGCNISGWGRKANYFKDGLAYLNEGDTWPINYDSAFSLYETGVVTIENCEVHSPRIKANSWKNGHPFGPNAVLVFGNNPDENYQGQIVIRNNRFYGSDAHRFNDVIESRINGSENGGFLRDSAIYNNYLAYANDDIIELDGSQFNVLVYNNEIEQGYCGISAIPNRQGPSFIFNNYIHNLGDENDKSWAAIKMGGVISRPAGKVNIFNNIIKTSSNGISYAGYNGDVTFWADIWTNIIISSKYTRGYGRGILDKKGFEQNNYFNNYVYNTVIGDSYNYLTEDIAFDEQNYNYLPIPFTDIGQSITFPNATDKNINNVIFNDVVVIGLPNN